MSSRLKEKEEKLLQILERLAEESAKGTPIIVEGKKDVEALRALSINGRIISAKTGGKHLIDVISELESARALEVILLLDFDWRGKELTRKLQLYLERTGIKINVTFWLELSAVVGNEVKDIEGLASYMETLKSKIGNS